ncbi:hypothetical protein HPP92_026730 [Vanilla planifolia]|uniref:BRX domain-containing protein n=1 Tax=Vanilla planifolia TaxID=51239 RepID=A0A835U7J5_VANPL|nr:hypothetical protein HPP92_026730 [Vanilla planifolia]
MLTCIACSKQQLGGGSFHEHDGADTGGGGTPGTRMAIKTITSQIKDMALKASGAYRHCKPCAGLAVGRRYEYSSEAASRSERFLYSYRRACNRSGIGFEGGSCGSTPQLRGLSSCEVTPSASGRVESASVTVAFLEQDDERGEWVAQVEPGVLITFLSLPHGGNDLKRIRFSREMFDKWQAQQWWVENHDKVMELYNVQRFNRKVIPLPDKPHSEDEGPNVDSTEYSPLTSALHKERLLCHCHRLASCSKTVFMCSEHQRHHCHHHEWHSERYCCGSGALASTPKLSSISGAKTEASSMDTSVRKCSSLEDAHYSGELSASVSNASDQEEEWVEEDEPGVYITIRSLPSGVRELRRVRFSRERFGEMHARLWWEENRARIREQYL